MRAGLKEEFWSPPARAKQAQDRGRRVLALMREVQGRRPMTSVKGKDDMAGVQASKIADAVKHFW